MHDAFAYASLPLLCFAVCCFVVHFFCLRSLRSRAVALSHTRTRQRTPRSTPRVSPAQLLPTTAICSSHIAAHRAKVAKRIEHYRLIVDTVNFDVAVQDDTAAEKEEDEAAELVDTASLETAAEAALSDGGEELYADTDGAGRNKKKKKGVNLLSKISGGRFGEGKLRAKINLTGRKVFSATRGLGTLTHSLSAPVDVRARIATVNTAMIEGAKYMAAKKALTEPLAQEADPDNPGEFLPPLVLVEPRRVSLCYVPLHFVQTLLTM